MTTQASQASSSSESNCASSSPSTATSYTLSSKPGLKKIAPYWYPYKTMAKGRWFDREILELVSTEFRDRSVEYYRYALESGVTTVNGKIAKPGTIVRNGDVIQNIVHRHEPPVTSTPIKILLHDKERDFIVINKPGSIPVHASGRYFKNSIVEILKDDFGFKNVYNILAVNRLDRLTSGLMIIALSADCARSLTEQFTAGTIRKEYIARVKGEFPAEPVRCEEPLLTVDRQMGLNIVHPEGKHAQTIFTRLHYDPGTDSSVLHCQPLTGRSHQLRVHLQYLGYPIANDPVYSDEKIWGNKLGRGGIDIAPSDERTAPVPPPQHEASPAEGRHRSLPEKSPPPKSPAWRTKAEAIALTAARAEQSADGEAPKLLPRETGHDIGMGSPVPLSLEAVRVITRLRNQKDEDEDWSRWRDVVFRAKGALKPDFVDTEPLPPHRRERPKQKSAGKETAESSTVAGNDLMPANPGTSILEVPTATIQPSDDAEIHDANVTKSELLSDLVAAGGGTLYCPECYLPLHPDPKPEKLYIFLHALRYTTGLGSFETEMPEWAAPGWDWDMK